MNTQELKEFIEWFTSTYKIVDVYEDENNEGDLEIFYEPKNLKIDDIIQDYYEHKEKLHK